MGTTNSSGTGSDDREAVRADKQRLRDSVLGMTRQLDPQVARDASHRVCGHLVGLRAVHLADTVALYRAVGHELDPRQALEVLDGRDVTTLLPRVIDDRIHLAASGDPGLLVAGRHGIPEPASGSVPVDEVDVIVVPGVAFDLDGGRLGRGGGHYDRLLASLPHHTVRIGLALSSQLVTRVPRESHDEVLDIIITPRGPHHSSARAAPRDA